MYYVAGVPYSAGDLYHFGIKGQKWGIRRFQNPDGTLTPEGKARYGTSENFENAMAYKEAKKFVRNNVASTAFNTAIVAASKGRMGKAGLAISAASTAIGAANLKDKRDKYKESLKRDMNRDLDKEESDARKKRLKTAAIATGSVAATALAVYGGVKLSQIIEKGNAEFLKTGRDNLDFVVDAVGNDKVKATIFEKAANAAKYYTGHSKRGDTMRYLNA